MTQRDPRDDEPIPEWLRKELETASPPSEETLARYAYMRHDFMARLRAEGARAGVVDAVFSLAGRLLRIADDAVARLAPQPPRPAFAFRGAETPGTPIDRLAKRAGEMTIEAATYRSGAGADIELNVLKTADRTELRPFTVTVYDAEGNALEGPLDVLPTHQAPRFPHPREGVYVFALTWPGGGGELRIEFAADG